MSLDDERPSQRKVTVSEELLRAVLAEFKLELFQDLRNYATQVAFDSLSSATAAAVEGLGTRVTALEEQNAWNRGGVARGRQFSAAALAWAAVIAALLSVVVALVLAH